MKTQVDSSSLETKKLEKMIKERYGRQRGLVMITDARQCAEYECDSLKFSETEFLDSYVRNLKRKL